MLDVSFSVCFPVIWQIGVVGSGIIISPDVPESPTSKALVVIQRLKVAETIAATIRKDRNFFIKARTSEYLMILRIFSVFFSKLGRCKPNTAFKGSAEITAVAESTLLHNIADTHIGFCE